MTIYVENIKCGGCSSSIKMALRQISGVNSVTIDRESEAVEYEGTADRSLLVEELRRLGYPEKGENNLLLQAKSYVSCMVGKMSNQETE
jgi:copper chaperone